MEFLQACRLVLAVATAAVVLPTQAADTEQPAAPVATSLPTLAVPEGYRLAWSDEFETPGLPDPAHWSYDTERNRAGWYNTELQYYGNARKENSVVRDGKLVITARREAHRSARDWGGQRYSSARLISRGKHEWTYGFVSVRARLPCGLGTWPAIWTLARRGPWPSGGELDIMEHVGRQPGRVLSTVHTTSGSGAHGVGGSVSVPDACTAFHDYQMLWTPTEVRFGVDGRQHFVYPNAGKGKAQWPFDEPQYMILNLAIGGDLGGAVDDAIFPVTMEVDHVRVWQGQAPR